MKTLFDPAAVLEVMKRADALTPTSPRAWGKMNIGQMLAHCSGALEMAMGRKNPRRSLMGYLIGPFFKNMYTNDKPFPRSSPTDASLVVTDEKDFTQERDRLKKLVEEFSARGEMGVTKNPHPFFGTLTPSQWGTGMYKHLDHHFTQFGG
jgi:hypothetical protein